MGSLAYRDPPRWILPTTPPPTSPPSSISTPPGSAPTSPGPSTGLFHRDNRTPKTASSQVAVGVFVDPHQISEPPHRFSPFSPACRLTDANVPFGMSSQAGRSPSPAPAWRDA